MSPVASLDIRPYACPLTWVKTRIALERLATGEVLELFLSEGEPLDNVPRSAEQEGHAVLSREPAVDGWRLLLRKGAAPAVPPPPWEA